MQRRVEITLEALAVVLLLFTAMLEPLVSLGLALVLLAVFALAHAPRRAGRGPS